MFSKKDTFLENQLLTVGHSPDADDAFMFYALAKGYVKVPGFQIRHLMEDIQSLNERALKGELEVTAISAAMYPLIQEKYWILSCGASVGRNYGPIVVSKTPLTIQDLSGKKIAVPGLQTTAYLLLRLFLKEFQAVPIDFKQIIPAIQSNSVDAGLIIHEGQLDYQNHGLTCCMDLGKIWQDQESLPIPLGLDVVRKDLGRERAQSIQKALYDSILYAKNHEEEALDYALQFGRGVDRKTGKQFVGMYVNEDTLDLGEEGQKALMRLFEKAYQKGLTPLVPKVEIIS